MNGLDQRGFTHAARTPQQHVIGGKTLRETQCVFVENVADMVDATDELQGDAVGAGNRLDKGVDWRPDETIGRIPVVYGGRRPGQTFHGDGEPAQF